MGILGMKGLMVTVLDQKIQGLIQGHCSRGRRRHILVLLKLLLVS